MVFVILTGYLYGPVDGAVIGLCMGFLRDMLASTTLGIGMLILLYVGIFSSLIFSVRFHRRAALGFVQVILVTLIYKAVGHVFYYVVPLLMSHDYTYISLQSVIFDSVLPQIAVNLAISIPMILLLNFLGPYRKGLVRASDENRMSSEDVWQIK